METVKGAAKIEYLVTGGFDTGGIPFPPALVKTLAAARQDVTERVKRSTTACEVRVTPTPLHTTVRGAGGPVAVTVDLEVEFTTTATAPRPIVGWLFFRDGIKLTMMTMMVDTEVRIAASQPARNRNELPVTSAYNLSHAR